MPNRRQSSIPKGAKSHNRSRSQANNAEVVFSKLQQALFKGEIRPNQRLVESEIAERFGISRTPVREALKRLEIMGYLTKLPKGGLIVAETSPRQLRCLLEIRDALETKAMALVCETITNDQLKKAEEYNELCTRAAKERNHDDYIRWNEAFHYTLLSSLRNEQLHLMILNIRNQFFYRQVVRFFSEKDWRTMIAQHKQIVNALRSRNSRLAKTVQRRHVYAVLKIVEEKW